MSRPRTHDRAVVITYRRKWGVAGGTAARPRRPKREGLWGPADLLPTGHSPISNPADSATLRLHSTSIWNVVTPLGLSAGPLAEQGEPYRRPRGG